MDTMDTDKTTQKERTAYIFLVAFVAAVGGFLFGYDLSIISGAQRYLKDVFQLNPQQFGFANASALLGCLAGPFVGAWMCDKVGRKRSLIFAALLFGISAVGTALPQTITQFNIFRIIGGIGVGLASVASPLYIAEIAPKKIRGMLVTMNQMAIVVGSLSAIIVAYLLAEHAPSSVSWRWMFGSECVPIIIFVAFLCTVPETPRWLAEHHRFDQARTVLERLHGQSEAVNEMDEIKFEIDREKHAPGISIRELFAPGIKIALLIGVVLSVMSQWTGWSVTGFYLPTILAQAGITDVAQSIKMAIIPNVANMFFTLIAIYYVDRVGRRPLYLICTLAMAITMSMLASVFIFKIMGWPVIAIVSLTAAPHAIGLGALSWLVISEIFPTRIRAKAMSLCTICLWLACFVITFSAPVLFDLSQRLFGVPSGVFFVCAIISLLSFFFVLKMLPETKGRSLEEIAKSWLNKSKTK
ncbi:MAG: hypothetical protein DRP56_07565, partial [Planctomycetota bacterium]